MGNIASLDNRVVEEENASVSDFDRGEKWGLICEIDLDKKEGLLSHLQGAPDGSWTRAWMIMI